MKKPKITFFYFLLTALLLTIPMHVSAQGGFDNSTRALYIFDMARYIDYGPGLADSAFFRIGVLDEDASLFWEMGHLRTTRPRIQDKPVDLVYFGDESKITPTHILFVSKKSGFDLKKIKAKIAGSQTMLITEGYAFNESMINFVVVDGKPEYELHEDKIKEAGMTVNYNMVYSAIKSKEDWENLFDEASNKIELQIEQIAEQQETIDVQKAEILLQKSLLDSLDSQIKEKEAILNDKQRQLDYQLTQITRQGREIAGQRALIESQQKEVADQKAVLDTQRSELQVQMTRLDEQLNLITQQEDKIKTQLATLEKQKLILYFVSFVLLMFVFLAYNIYRNYKIKKEPRSCECVLSS